MKYSISVLNDEGGVLCHREEEVRVQGVRAAEAVRRAVGAVRVRREGVAVRLTVAPLIVVITNGRTAEAVHRRFLQEESGGISRQGFRRI